MQNEKLFKKIKYIALTETTDTEDWNPDNVWAKVQKKKKRHKTWLWLPYAAASVLLITGLFIWISNGENKKHNAVSNVSNPKIPEEKIIKNESIKDFTTSFSKIIPISVVKNMKSKKYIVSKKSSKKVDTLLLFIHSSINNKSITDGTIEQIISADADTAFVEKNLTASSEKNTGKILIANISLPEQKPEELSALRQIFDQVKKEREARKMRMKFSVTGKKTGLWSFVQQSFVEFAPVEKTIITRKRP